MKETLEIDLKEMFRVIIKRIWAIVLCILVTGAAVYAYVATMVPDMYRAKVTMYINNKEEGSGSNVTSANLTVAQKLVNTYATFIQSDLILEKVIAETGILKTASQVRGMVSTESVNGTEMFAVWVTSQNPHEAALIADAIADIAPDEISGIIEGSYAKKVDTAKVPSTPIPARRVLKAILGGIAGGFLSALFFILQSMLDTHVRSEEELEKIGNIPVLGAIPDFAQPVKEPKKGRK